MSLYKDGTMLELVRMPKHNEGPDDLTAEELDQWVEAFPVQDFRCKNAASFSNGSR
jgi:hypothetical protein